MKITSPILKHLSLQISKGNPWWGMVVANEYLPTSAPLHHALASNFIRRIGSTSGELKILADTLIAGARYDQLNPDLQQLVGNRWLPPLRKADPLPRIAQGITSRTARRLPDRLRNNEQSSHLNTRRKDRQGIRSTIHLNAKNSSLAPRATLRGVRTS
jgi:hypothetical protein